MVLIKNAKTKRETLEREFSDADIINVTSNSEDDAYRKLSPFYPHGKIPIPFWEGKTAQSVEGIWQGLKVFENEGIDTSKFEITNMENIKRTIRKFGKPKGHQAGYDINAPLLDYLEARKKIYLPAYNWVLENCIKDIVIKINEISKSKDIILLDYNTNDDLENGQKPLSHAAIIIKYIKENFDNEYIDVLHKEPPKPLKRKKKEIGELFP